MKKIEINKRLYNVLDSETYIENKDIYNPRFTALEVCGGQYVFPVNSRITDKTPGVYIHENGMVNTIIKPNENDIGKYSAEKIIDYSNIKDINDIYRNNKLVRDIQNDIITNGDNILQLNIGDNDTPEMKVLKEAINAKGIDKKQYEDRFDQYQNDMRLLKGRSITLSKLISICSAFDISAQLTLRDKDDVPNPIGKELTVDLTSERGDNIK
jgi:hypothetical protein